MGLLTLLRGRPDEPSPYHRIGTKEPHSVRMQRHRKAYAALNELAEMLGIVNEERYPICAVGMGTEDFVQAVIDITRVARERIEDYRLR